MIAVGLMSGTSLDGIDAALVEIVPKGLGYDVHLREFLTQPFDANLSQALSEVLPPHEGSAAKVAQVHRMLGEAYARAASSVAGNSAVDYAAMHGQTVFHDGRRGITLQLGSPYFLRDRLRASVCFDFRSADCALGGHGAPLVPYADALLLASTQEDRVAANVGGIANITYLPRGGRPQDAVAYDTGPGNMLLDAFVQNRSGGSTRFDEGGAIAASGSIATAVLDVFMSDEYFSEPPPKSTGRERFGSQFLEAHSELLTGLSLPDGAATLTALTARSMAEAVRRTAPRGARVLVSGGGALNATLLRGLQERLWDYRVETSDTMNLRADGKEAITFALLGYETLRERPANLPRVTGASAQCVLGSIAPYELGSLLQRVRAECAG